EVLANRPIKLFFFFSVLSRTSNLCFYCYTRSKPAPLFFLTTCASSSTETRHLLRHSLRGSIVLFLYSARLSSPFPPFVSDSSSPTHEKSMPPRDVELSVNEKNFVLEALKKGLRIDGREFDAFRDVKIEFGEEYGLVDVTLGKTRFVQRSSLDRETRFYFA